MNNLQRYHRLGDEKMVERGAADQEIKKYGDDAKEVNEEGVCWWAGGAET